MLEWDLSMLTKKHIVEVQYTHDSAFSYFISLGKLRCQLPSACYNIIKLYACMYRHTMD